MYLLGDQNFECIYLVIKSIREPYVLDQLVNFMYVVVSLFTTTPCLLNKDV